MNDSLRGYAFAGACAGALAVVAGAFGAHALGARIDAESLHVWQTAVDYQFWHALAVLLVVTLAPDPATRGWRLSAACFLSGIVAFCLSLYALALGAPRFVGMITPVGGLLFIAGWVLLASTIWRGSRWRS